MKNNLGITMVEVVVVIVIMLMIIVFAVGTGAETLNQADITDLYVEISSVKTAVNGVITKQNMDETYILTEGKQYDLTFEPASGVNYSNDILNNSEDWYIIIGNDNPAYEDSLVTKELGLEKINHTYMVNYETAEVELYKPVEVAGYLVRTYGQIRSLVEN